MHNYTIYATLYHLKECEHLLILLSVQKELWNTHHRVVWNIVASDRSSVLVTFVCFPSTHSSYGRVCLDISGPESMGSFFVLEVEELDKGDVEEPCQPYTWYDESRRTERQASTHTHCAHLAGTGRWEIASSGWVLWFLMMHVDQK